MNKFVHIAKEMNLFPLNYDLPVKIKDKYIFSFILSMDSA